MSGLDDAIRLEQQRSLAAQRRSEFQSKWLNGGLQLHFTEPAPPEVGALFAEFVTRLGRSEPKHPVMALEAYKLSCDGVEFWATGLEYRPIGGFSKGYDRSNKKRIKAARKKFRSFEPTVTVYELWYEWDGPSRYLFDGSGRCAANSDYGWWQGRTDRPQLFNRFPSNLASLLAKSLL